MIPFLISFIFFLWYLAARLAEYLAGDSAWRFIGWMLAFSMIIVGLIFVIVCLVGMDQEFAWYNQELYDV